jgi:glycosyltransferase involved in cell wall biosynthesis
MDACNTRGQSAPNAKNAQVGFSVVMPSFNHARFIAEALNSLLDQRYENLEIIVVDGGSTDGTVGILRSYRDRICWISEKDDGQSDALAKGFAMATQEWLTWLNSDDVQTNNALYYVQKAIRNNPGVQVVVGQGHYIDEAGNYLRPYPTIAAGPGIDVSKELFEKGYVAQPSVFFHHDAYQAVGGINPTLQFAMDYDLWVRLARNGCRFVAVTEDISGNRWYETTKTASQYLPLLADVVAVQMREYQCVSPYFVQAISDHLYSALHSLHRHDGSHVLYRIIYFKSVWVWLNCHRPFYCLWGLITQNIAKSGPIVGDKLTLLEMLQFSLQAFKQRFQHFLGRGSR